MRTPIKLNAFAMVGLVFSAILGAMLLAETGRSSTSSIMIGIGGFWLGYLIAVSGDSELRRGEGKSQTLTGQILSFSGMMLMTVAAGWIILWCCFRWSGMA